MILIACHHLFTEAMPRLVIFYSPPPSSFHSRSRSRLQSSLRSRSSHHLLRCSCLCYCTRFCLCVFLFFFFNLIYSRWTSSLPSCLWLLRIFPSLPGSRLTIFYRDASSALLQLVNQWLNFTYSRSHAFRYERKNTNPTLVSIELTISALAGVQVT